MRLKFRVKKLALVARHLSLGTYRLALVALFASLFSSCHVHEWPKDNNEPLLIDLDFFTDFHIVNYSLEETKADDLHSYSVEYNHGIIYYTIRAYPLFNNDIDENIFIEHTYIRNLALGQNDLCELNLSPGKYRITAFAQISEFDDNIYFYDESDFNEIKLVGEYSGAHEYRDVFSGVIDIEVGENRYAKLPMTRPTSKYELIATDLAEFFQREEVRMKSKGLHSRNSLDDYNVVFYYIGYMPSAYNLYEDRNVDSKMGVSFTSSPVMLNDNEVSLGFDYVFTSVTQTYITVQVALYEKESGIRVSLSDEITIPLKRDDHTVVTGNFLFKNANSGFDIDAAYDDEFNLYFEM